MKKTEMTTEKTEMTPQETAEAPPIKRFSLGLKVSAKTKALIDAEARETGLSQSQIAERWIELMLRYESALGKFDEWNQGLSAKMQALEDTELRRVMHTKGWVPVRNPKTGQTLYAPPEVGFPKSGFVADTAEPRTPEPMPMTATERKAAEQVTEANALGAGIMATAASQRLTVSDPRLVEMALELLTTGDPSLVESATTILKTALKKDAS